MLVRERKCICLIGQLMSRRAKCIKSSGACGTVRTCPVSVRGTVSEDESETVIKLQAGSFIDRDSDSQQVKKTVKLSYRRSLDTVIVSVVCCVVSQQAIVSITLASQSGLVSQFGFGVLQKRPCPYCRAALRHPLGTIVNHPTEDPLDIHAAVIDCRCSLFTSPRNSWTTLGRLFTILRAPPSRATNWYHLAQVLTWTVQIRVK